MFFEVSSLCSRHWGDWIASGGRLEGLWMVSDWFWILQRLYWWNNNWWKSFCMILFNYCLPTDALYNANIDRFDGVCKVSGVCLAALNSAWRVIMPNQLMTLQWRNIEKCFNWLVPSLSMTLDWTLSALSRGVCRVSIRCLGGVLGCLGDFGYCLGWGGGVWYEINLWKFNLSHFDQLVPSLPSASECLNVVWKVSERCLEVVWVILDTVWGLWCASTW